MRKLSVSNITDTVAMPIKSGTLEHLQLAYQEAIAAVAQNLLGKSVDNTKCYILYGCKNTGTGQSYIISAGALYYNGEVFLVDGVSFTAGSGKVAVAQIVTSQYITNADPVLFTNGIEYNVHNIRKIAIVEGVTGAGVCDFSNFLETGYIVKSETVANLGSAYTIKFDQERSIFFQAASSNNVISFDFTNAIPGAVVRAKFTMSTQTFSIAAQSGVDVVLEGLSLTSAGSNTNVVYFFYAGKNAAGNHEVAVNLKNI